MLFLKILACINKRTHQKQQQGNHRRGFLAAVFGIEMRAESNYPPAGFEFLFKFSSVQKLLLLEVKSLLCRAQEIIQRFLAVDAHPVRQHHQPPDAFADFVLQSGSIRRFNIL